MRKLQFWAAFCVAAFGVGFVQAQDRISISFGSTVTGSTGVVSTPAAGWYGTTYNSGAAVSGSNLTVSGHDGTATTTTAVSLTYSAANTWEYGSSADGAMSLLYHYLDDGGSGASITVSNIPYSTYDVYIYCATDTGSATFSAMTVNNVAYTYSDGATVEGSTAWGASQTSTLVEGTNYLHITGQTSSTLTIVGGVKSGSTRGCIAGIQIVNTGSDVANPTLTLAADTTDATWNTSTWTLSDEATTAPTSGTAEISVAGTTTLTLDAAVDLTVLGVSGDGTLTFAAGESGSLASDVTAIGANVDATSGVTSLGTATIDEGKTLTIPSLSTVTAANGVGTLKVTSDSTISDFSVLGSGTNLTIAGGTTEVTSSGSGTGILSGRTVEVTGSSSVLKLGASDTTGWSTGGVLSLTEGGTLSVGTRDTFLSSMTMRNGTMKLLSGCATVNSSDSGRGFDLYGNPSVVTVQAASGASEESPTVSTWEAETTDTSSYIAIRSGALNIAIDQYARLDVDASITYNNGYGSTEGALNKTGLGTLVLNRANTYSKGTNISEGTVQLTGEGSLGTGKVTISAGAVLDVAGSTSTVSELENNGSITVSSGAITLPASTAGSVTVSEGATLNLQLTDEEAGIDGITISGITNNNGTVTLLGSSGESLEYTTAEDGTITYTATPPTWTNGSWSSEPTADGVAVIDFASVSTTETCSLSVSSLSILIIKGTGTVNVGTALTLTELRLDDSTDSSVTFSNSAALTITGSISGSAALTFSAGSVIIQNPVIVASSSYTGAVTLSGGTVTWGNNGGSVSAGTNYTFGSSLTINSGATFYVRTWTTQSYNKNESGKLYFSTPIVMNGGTLTTEDGSYRFVSIDAEAASNLTFGYNKGIVIYRLFGAGNLTVTSVNAGYGGAFVAVYYSYNEDESVHYTGSLSMGGGMSNRIATLYPDTTATFNRAKVSIGGYVQLSLGGNRTIGALSGSGAVVSSDSTNTRTLTIAGYNSTAETFSGSISDNINLALSANAAQGLTGTLGSSGAYSKAIALNSGSTLTLTPSTATTLSGVISGAGTLAISGSNAVTLSGTNTHTGATTVASGSTLTVSGSTASAVSVASEATLAGSGSVSGAVSFADGAILDITSSTTEAGLTLSAEPKISGDFLSVTAAEGATAGTIIYTTGNQGTSDVASQLDVSGPTTTLFVSPTTTGYTLVEGPSITLPDGTPDTVRAELQEVAANSGITSPTFSGTVKGVDITATQLEGALDCFDSIISVNTSEGTIDVSYDFGISSIKPQVATDGTAKLLVTATVLGKDGAETATYADGTTVTLTVGGTALDPVTPDTDTNAVSWTIDVPESGTELSVTASNTVE